MSMDHCRVETTDLRGMLADEALTSITSKCLSLPLIDTNHRQKGLPTQPNEPSLQPIEMVPASISGNWFGLSQSQISDDLYRNLLLLALLPKGWKGEGSQQLRSGSLRHFLKFMRLAGPEVVEPFIGLTPDGNIYAEWHKSWKCHFDAIFKENGLVLFGLIVGRSIREGVDEVGPLSVMMKSDSRKPLEWRS